MIEAAKGTRDILPEEMNRWHFVEAVARDTFERYGFREIRTPIFESTELFARGIGAATDIVAKEMYTFLDRKGRSLTLRPENTAPVVRAYIQHQRHRSADVDRLYYIGPMFRYERPQKGRMRQFSQLGVEVFGSDHPVIDAEAIEMVMSFVSSVGVRPVALSLNSVGCHECRPAYRDALVRYLTPRAAALCEDCRRRLQTNPLRCFDCKVPADQEVMTKAPIIADHLCAACCDHFAAVRSHLDALEVPYKVEPRLVRGLDYYRRTAFEVTQPALGAQNAILGGGRYDGLVEELGGPPVPGFGFAIGQDRLILALPADAPIPDDAPDVVVVALGAASIRPALLAARRLRRLGRRVIFDPLPGKSLKAQMRHANALRARTVIIVGEEEISRGMVTLKRMADGTQETIRTEDLEARIEALGHA